MRLIEANELFDKVGKIKPRNKEHYKSIGEFMHLISNSPTIDAVEVVRCKDCKYFEEDLYKGLFEGDGVCFHEHWVLEDTGFEVKETDYCSFGEREEE